MLKRVYGSVDHFPGQDSPYVPYASPEPVAHLSQHKLLPILLERAEASPRTASIWFGTQVTAIRDRGSEVAVTVEHASARSERHKRTIVCSHLVAADGANSRVRDWLELPMEGDACLQNLINIHFFSKDLAQQLSKRPAMLYFCFNRATVAVIVAHSLADGEFVAQVPFFPPLQVSCVLPNPVWKLFSDLCSHPIGALPTKPIAVLSNASACAFFPLHMDYMCSVLRDQSESYHVSCCSASPGRPDFRPLRRTDESKRFPATQAPNAASTSLPFPFFRL